MQRHADTQRNSAGELLRGQRPLRRDRGSARSRVAGFEATVLELSWYGSRPVAVPLGPLPLLGPAFVASSAGSADATGPKALRASMGALFRVPLVGFDEAPGRRVALVAHGGSPLADTELSEHTTFVLGAEREGLPEEVLARCESRVTIPLAEGAESLNVAAAGAIALYELGRRL